MKKNKFYMKHNSFNEVSSSLLYLTSVRGMQKSAH